MTSAKEHSKLSLTLLDKGFKISVLEMLRDLQKTQVSSLTKSGEKIQTIQEVQYRDRKHKKNQTNFGAKNNSDCDDLEG